MTRQEIVLRLRQISIDSTCPEENDYITIALHSMCAIILWHREEDMASALTGIADDCKWMPDDIGDMVIK